VARKSLEQYRREAPEVPTNTCPYIDFIQDINREISDECESEFIRKKIEVIDSLLEYVRSSNENLRKSSHFWYTKFKSKLNK
jgi:hypothetical protein